MKAFAPYLSASYVVALTAPGTTIWRNKFMTKIEEKCLSEDKYTCDGIQALINTTNTYSECISKVKD